MHACERESSGISRINVVRHHEIPAVRWGAVEDFNSESSCSRSLRCIIEMSFFSFSCLFFIIIEMEMSEHRKNVQVTGSREYKIVFIGILFFIEI
jgi:hypothetical protein